MSDQRKNHSSKRKERNRQVLRYSGLAFQLFAVIGLGSYAGYWLDGYMGNKVPYMLLIFMLVSTTLALYSLYKKLPKD